MKHFKGLPSKSILIPSIRREYGLCIKENIIYDYFTWKKLDIIDFI